MPPLILLLQGSARTLSLLGDGPFPGGARLQSCDTGAADALACRPDLVLVDVDAGLAALRALRAHRNGGPTPPIVALTGDAGTARREALFAAGADDYLLLPACVAERDARIAAQLARAAAPTTAAPPPAAHRAHGNADEPSRVLLVDDSPTNIRTLHRFLGNECKIIAATSGVAALELCARQVPDLVLLDVDMPELDGYEVCRRLKRDPRTAGVPVIFVTGRDEEADELAGFELGAVDYIVKPFSLPVVQRRVRTHLELKRCRDLLEQQSQLDGLTGIANRRRFDTAFEQGWAHAVRSGSTLSLLLFDVDHFKAYNDHYGHRAGDDCLRRIAQTLSEQCTRESDLLARYGGEEFACVLPGTDHDGALDMAQQLRVAVERMDLAHARNSAGSGVTVSVGLASACPRAGDVATQLLEAADQALYRAKQGGRNRVEA